MGQIGFWYGIRERFQGCKGKGHRNDAAYDPMFFFNEVLTDGSSRLLTNLLSEWLRQLRHGHMYSEAEVTL